MAITLRTRVSRSWPEWAGQSGCCCWWCWRGRKLFLLRFPPWVGCAGEQIPLSSHQTPGLSSMLQGLCSAAHWHGCTTPDPLLLQGPQGPGPTGGPTEPNRQPGLQGLLDGRPKDPVEWQWRCNPAAASAECWEGAPREERTGRRWTKPSRDQRCGLHHVLWLLRNVTEKFEWLWVGHNVSNSQTYLNDFDFPMQHVFNGGIQTVSQSCTFQQALK